MTDLRLILFDDSVAACWEPFALTRPAGELIFGALTLRERAERVFRARCSAHLAADHLQGFDEPGSPPVLRFDDAPCEGDRLFLCSRAVPAWDAATRLSAGAAGPVSIDGEVVGWFSPDRGPTPGADFFANPGAAGPAGLELPGRVLHHVWDLISGNADQVARDIHALHPSPEAPDPGPGVYRLGDQPLVMDPTVWIEPETVLDTSDGPIWLDRGVSIRAFTRLAGPAYVGAGSTILGGTLKAVSIGPVCKVRGELAESVCLGFANKAHDGHIGHSYLGRWVNLGAGTTNSDLKNNYGTIRMRTEAGDVDTGLLKLGCLLGDHVKTGIGLLLNTGTVVGAGSNLFGAAMPPRRVPPFSWGVGAELTEYRVEKFLEVAERAMARREMALTPGLRRQLEAAWRRGRAGVGAPGGARTRSETNG